MTKHKPEPKADHPPGAPDTRAPAAPDLSAAAAGPSAQQAPEMLQSLRAELEAAKDRALRAHAELDNYRKRVAREMEDERRYASLPLVRDLLPVLDNVHRAIAAAEKTPDPTGLLQGFRMVAEQLEGVLVRHHCLEIDALHEPFDPNRHEAILQQPSEEHPSGTVLLVTRPGFQMHQRVVRPSQVIVSAESQPEERETPEEPESNRTESQES